MPLQSDSGGYNSETAADAAAAAAGTSSTTSKASLLPPGTTDKNGDDVSGTYDIYGLGQISNAQLYMGDADSDYGAQGPHGRQNTRIVSSPTYSSAYGLMQQYAGLAASNPGEYANIQVDLYNAGFLTSKPNWGVWGPKDGDAVGSAIQAYLQLQQSGSPLSFAEYLAQSSSMGKANGFGTGSSAGGGGAASVIQLTDPKVLEADANSAAQSSIHRNLTAGEQAKFVARQHAAEAGEQTATGGTVTTAGDPTATALTDIQTNDNPEYQQALQASYIDTINNVLGVK